MTLLIGAAIPFLVGLLVYISRRFRAGFRLLILTPVFTALGMAWASAPDLPRVLGFHDFYNQLHTDPRINIFFWHYTIDRIETESPVYAMGFMLLFVAFILAAWRELRLAEGEA